MPDIPVPTSSRSFRAFVERHDRLFTTIAFLILVITFFVKEDLREQAQGLASSLKNGQTNYGIVMRLGYISDLVQSVDTRLSFQRQPGSEDRADTKALIDSRSQLFDGSQNNFQLSREMLKAFPVAEPALAAREQKLNGELTGPIAEAVARMNEARNAYGGARILGQHTDAVRMAEANVLEASQTFDRLADAFRREALAFNIDVVREGDVQLRRAEARVHTATVLSYVTFAFGAILSLAGKLLKLPALA